MIPVLIIGKSGAGKSASLRNLPTVGTVVVNVLGKPLPFRSDLKVIHCDDYAKISAAIKRGAFERCVIDDAGYLMTSQFMGALAARGNGGNVYSLYSDMAQCLWNLIRDIQGAPGQQRVYLMFHEERSDLGDIKPRTYGRLIEEKVCLEGMVTICLRAMVSGGRHVFRTQSDGFDVTKAPMGMFAQEEIDNDLALVDDTIVEYYKINKEETSNENG